MALDEAIPPEHDGDSHGFHHSGLHLRDCDFDGGSLDLVLEGTREEFRQVWLCCCGWVDRGRRYWGGDQCCYADCWHVGRGVWNTNRLPGRCLLAKRFCFFFHLFFHIFFSPFILA